MPRKPLFRWLNFVLSLVVIYFLITYLFPGFLPTWRPIALGKEAFLFLITVFVAIFVIWFLGIFRKFIQMAEEREKKIIKESNFDLKIQEKLERKRKIRRFLFWIVAISFIFVVFYTLIQ